MSTDLLTATQLAEEWGLPTQTLAQWRYLGTGPAFVKLGPRTVRYRRADVDAWLEQHRMTRTDEPAALAAAGGS